MFQDYDLPSPVRILPPATTRRAEWSALARVYCDDAKRTRHITRISIADQIRVLPHSLRMMLVNDPKMNDAEFLRVFTLFQAKFNLATVLC